MDVFEHMVESGHEQVVWCHHRETGLRAIIAIHDTTLGPSLGGCRFYDYASERDALIDVLRLSRGMTYKAAVAGLDLGGGKAVIIGDPSTGDEALFRAFGRFVDSLGGRYITAEDMNTDERAMEWISKETDHVTGLHPSLGGSGDPGPVTAWGVYHGIRACLEHVYGSPDPAGRTVAIQGVGSVGFALARHLHEAGAELVFADIDEQAVAHALEAFGGRGVDDEQYYGVDCDVLAPCAIGAVLDERTIPRIRAPIVAGSANNQLAVEERDSEALHEHGILYAPDYVINAGGLIHVNGELHGWSRDKTLHDAARIGETVKHVIDVAEAQGITTEAASNHVAEDRIAAMNSLHRLHRPG